MTKHSHYFIDVSAYASVDVYRMIELIGITCPVAQHVFKKAWATGKRGHKDLRRDWQDIADSADRKLRMLDEDNGWTDEAIRAAAFGQQNTFDHRTEEQKAADPRTVAGVDVSFDTEKHLNFAPSQVGVGSRKREECKHDWHFHFVDLAETSYVACRKCGLEPERPRR